GVTVQKKSTAILEIVALTSPDGRYDSLFMGNYATINLVNELARVPGVGNVNVLGIGQYSMRIWMDPQRLYAYGLTPADVVQVVQSQSQSVTAGQVGGPPAPKGQEFQYTIDIEGRLADPVQFGNIVIKSQNANGGSVLRLKDVARIELGAQTYSQSMRLDGKPAAGLAIYQLPEANALAVAGLVEKKMEELSKAFPPGLAFVVPFNTTDFVKISINEVFSTLIEAGVLVLIVIVIFLQDWRAMLVPATTIPVTIIGAFAAMAALGFTINLSTLFGIVLAIGIVVDDAIVIVEGVARYIDEGMSGHDAAIKAMSELMGPVIGITLVLMSVFIPAAFLPGLTGKMFAQFALVIAATAFISAINAATLKPTQCALWLRPAVPPEKRNVFFRWFNAGYDRMEAAYTRLIGAMVHRSALMVVVALAFAGVGAWGVARLPSAFIPNEDQGYLLAGLQLPDGASLERTESALQEVSRMAKAIPGVRQVTAIAGISILDNSAALSNAGVAYVVLDDWGTRGKHTGQDVRSILFKLMGELPKLQDGRGFVLPPPPIQGIGNASGFQMQIEQRDGSYDFAKLQAMTQNVVEQARTQSAVANPISSFRAGAPHFIVDVDRSKAEILKVSVGDVFSTLSAYLGSTYINRFNKFGLSLQVFTQADSAYREKPDDILKLTVRSADDKMVPIGAVARLRSSQGASIISLYNLYPSAAVVGQPGAGFSSGEAMDVMNDLARHALPPGASYEWTAMSYQEAIVGNQILYVFGLAILLVYLCLAGQYESWIAPLSVILAVPLALIGPALALSAVGLPNNLYTQIGLMLLIALSAKNAILIVEVAREERGRHGKPIVEAAIEAARARLRPILMTSFAFILGVVPLVTASGAGAAARVSLGLCVFSGMIASTCLAVLFVPSFFAVLQAFEERLKSSKATATPAAV
ncbi:MAG: efflux RND transporter permease subunit, partial [Alphaproteobacteria bacterium]|nr:efflux RND transporter permease subunit [Alphaproteobacteria bacterium]